MLRLFCFVTVMLSHFLVRIVHPQFWKRLAEHALNTSVKHINALQQTIQCTYHTHQHTSVYIIQTSAHISNISVHISTHQHTLYRSCVHFKSVHISNISTRFSKHIIAYQYTYLTRWQGVQLETRCLTGSRGNSSVCSLQQRQWSSSSRNNYKCFLLLFW